MAPIACQLLDGDHLAAKHLFVEYARLSYVAGALAGTFAAAAPGADVDDGFDNRAALPTTICDELTLHAQIEVRDLCPDRRGSLCHIRYGLEADDQLPGSHERGRTRMPDAMGLQWRAQLLASGESVPTRR